MNKTVHNCIDCPLADHSRFRYSTFYECKVSIETEGIIVYDDSELEEIDYPLPTACPLRTDPITISLTN